MTIKTVFAQCVTCNSVESVDVDTDTFHDWRLRAGLVQEMFPELTPSQREVLIGNRSDMHTCAECWDQLRVDEQEADMYMEEENHEVE